MIAAPGNVQEVFRSGHVFLISSAKSELRSKIHIKVAAESICFHMDGLEPHTHLLHRLSHCCPENTF